MKTRLLIGFAVLLVALLLLFEAFDPAFTGRVSDLLLNVGTELIGIVLTVVIIDIMLERRRLRDEARRIATTVLHDLDHHVWVWQGGARGFDLAELSALINGVESETPVPPFTQNLFLNLGSRSSNTLRTSSEVVASSSLLNAGLEALSGLSTMRDAKTHLPADLIALTLRVAIPPLASAAGLTMPLADQDTPLLFRDASVESQEWRHFGKRKDAEPTIPPDAAR